jgi:hypothetical protein
MSSSLQNSSADPFDALFLALEDLLRRIADTDDPELRHKRAKLRAEMIALQSALPHISAPLPPPAARTVHIVLEEEVAEEEAVPDWGQPALAALTGVALVLTVFQAH